MAHRILSLNPSYGDDKRDNTINLAFDQGGAETQAAKDGDSIVWRELPWA